MSRDPFDDAILECLVGLDATQLELCTLELLRDIFPRLGRLAEPSDTGPPETSSWGPPYALVATRGDFVDALAERLDEAARRNDPRRLVIAATASEPGLEDRQQAEISARELGFTLVRIIAGRPLVDLLAADPARAWRLVGVAERPRSLARAPREAPLAEIGPVGREDAVRWLERGRGDQLLVGRPGSGRTTLLRHLCRHGGGLFVVDHDPEALRRDLQELKPQVMAVDDAHLDPVALAKLRELRDACAPHCEILAVSDDEGESREAAALALGVPPTRILELPLLDDDQIVELVRQSGLDGDDKMLDAIVSGAAGNPGLATSLTHFALHGADQALAENGDLPRHLVPLLARRFGCREIDLLAGLALGGEIGFPLASLADAFGMNTDSTREHLARSAASGLWKSIGKSSQAVFSGLRAALLCEIFYRGKATDLDHRPLLDRVVSRRETAGSVVRAAHLGGEVPRRELQELILSDGSERIWKSFAALGEKEAEWVLEVYPRTVAVSYVAIHSAPGPTLRRLLDLTSTDQRDPLTVSSHPLRPIRQWIFDPAASTEEALRRRQLLAETVDTWGRSGGDSVVAVRALLLALAPWTTDRELASEAGRAPADRPPLPKPALRELQDHWAIVLHHLGTAQPKPSAEIFESILASWSFLPTPEIEDSTIDEVSLDTRIEMEGFAKRMIGDLLGFYREQLGARYRLKEHASSLEMSMIVSLDPAFELLSREGEGGEERERSLCLIAEQQVERDLDKLVPWLVRIGEGAQEMGWERSHWLRVLYREIGRQAESPGKILNALLNDEVPFEILEPLLEGAAAGKDAGAWEDVARRLLEDECYREAVVVSVLTHDGPPDDVLDRTLELLGDLAERIRELARVQQVPIATLRRLLEHQRDDIALAAAEGEWMSDPRGEVREEVREACRQAILRSPEAADEMRHTASHRLGTILASNPALAEAWLERRLRRESFDPTELSTDPYSVALRALHALDSERKLRLIGLIQGGDDNVQAFVALLVGEDLDTYRALLADIELNRFHLAPLRGYPYGVWGGKAKLALQAGVAPGEIASAAYRDLARSQASSAEVEEWDAAFAALAEAEPELAEVAEHGRRLAKS